MTIQDKYTLHNLPHVQVNIARVNMALTFRTLFLFYPVIMWKRYLFLFYNQCLLRVPCRSTKLIQIQSTRHTSS